MRAEEPAGMEDLALAQCGSIVGRGPNCHSVPVLQRWRFWQHGFINMSVGASRMAAWLRWWRRATSSKPPLPTWKGLRGCQPARKGANCRWRGHLGLTTRGVPCLRWLARDASSLMNAGCDEARVTRCSNKTPPSPSIIAQLSFASKWRVIDESSPRSREDATWTWSSLGLQVSNPRSMCASVSA